MVTHTCRELALVYQASGFYKVFSFVRLKRRLFHLVFSQEALGFEKRYNKVISRFYKPDDEKVKESNELLSTLTGQAVHDARERVKQAKVSSFFLVRSCSLFVFLVCGQALPQRAQASKGRGGMSVLPKPGSANMAPLSRVLNLINKGRQP